MKCPNCDHENIEGDKFCSNCGKSLLPKKTRLKDFWEKAKAAIVYTFNNLGYVIVKPVTMSEKLVEPNGVVVGLLFMFIYSLPFIVGINILQGTVGDYTKVVPMEIAVNFVIFITLGFDIIEALLIRGLAFIFRIKMDIKRSFVTVGITSLYSYLLLSLMAIMALINPILSLVVFVVTFPLSTIMKFAIMRRLADGSENRKVAMYVLTRVIMFVVGLGLTGLFSYLFVKTMISNMVNLVMQYINSIDIGGILDMIF